MPQDQTKPKPEPYWWKANWGWAAALALTVIGLVLLISRNPQVCEQVLGQKDNAGHVDICRAVVLTDPVVLAWVAVVVLLLWGSISEGSVAGLFTFKRLVHQAVADSKTAKETAERALLVGVSQRQATEVTVLQQVEAGVPAAAWARGVAGDLSDREQVAVDAAMTLTWAGIRVVLEEMMESLKLPVETTRAYVYIRQGDLLARPSETPTTSRTWQIGQGAVGQAWNEGKLVTSKRGDPDFDIHLAKHFIGAVAAIPIRNVNQRPIGVLSLDSRSDPPADLDNDDVALGMAEAADQLARIYVNLAGWETDSATGRATQAPSP
ncbi:MAG: hypothetical protein QM711_17425 [Micropruina sp.]|uniref:GAF domain-containing protein n=1 Tax=Micropruina sp. TaxID=2737536 RepID=UPI0039E279FC